MGITNYPNSMLELLFSLSDEALVDMAIENPEVLNSICMGVSFELHQIENNESSSNRRNMC
jgi:hypothetical protein